MCWYKNAGVAGYAEAFRPVQSDSQTSEWYSYFENDVLGYDNVDIVERLKTLCVKEYSETKIDKDNTHPPLLFVFGKVIDGKEVYIKIKLRERAKRDIACISFHFAKNKMEYPYR